MKWMTSAALALALTTTGVQAAEVEVNRVFDASIKKVWKKFGKFCAIQRWQSLVDTCDVYENKRGIHRAIVMDDGGVFVERLLEYSDLNHSFTYNILSGPVPVTNYLSTLKFEDIGNRQTLFTWTATFDVDYEIEQDVVDNLYTLFENGVDGMEDIINKTNNRQPTPYYNR
ncbi:SRPBCC family protein [Litoribrevibacter albus]|uniref:SRPBCC family protein n=1 Tax=Litoribrevibacter albus TaxID=1473156 RepID=A0AA37W5B3_9GAMM|nr:SRPBCC family protein [Litoribrevibacter albus]GLQ30415.1 hypothetical protein GCM10007876_08930 [Litoribrevibacter albus]